MAAIETRADLVSGWWARAEAEALAAAADVGVRAATRRAALQRPATAEHALTLLAKAIVAAGKGRTAPVSVAWTRAEAAALAARAREGVGLGEEFGIVAAPALAARAVTALEAFIADAELVPAPTPQPPRRASRARQADAPARAKPAASARRTRA